ncbi:MULTISPECIES: LysM domain-containing protein [Arthrobacter]|uniref:LysM domain-containing protein n=2 Tax=Arthrobacter TaxID=1663 RepID=A0ABU9KMK8_9MICC|nr:LysM domain-containing protein [Arthrobacter sp. YJM1]MDP5227945.1 LysM domain-containing protein [Arthrobacter sp. YJM1]
MDNTVQDIDDDGAPRHAAAPWPAAGGGQEAAGEAVASSDAVDDSPAPGAPSEGPAEAGPGVVVVQRPLPRPASVTVGEGDTLEVIAERWGVDTGELAALNAWMVPNPAYLFPGQVLRLPS